MPKAPAKKKLQSEATERELPLDSIIEPETAARIHIPEKSVQELAASLKALGQLQAIAVCPRGNKFEIIYGHRRFLAAKLAKFTTIRAQIKDVTTEQLWAMRITENDERLDTSPLEQAHAYRQLQTEAAISQKQLAGRLGKSEAYVSQRLAILDYPAKLQAALGARAITFSVARELAKIQDPSALDMYLNYCVENGATPALAARWVSDLKMIAGANGTPEQHIDPEADIEALAPPTARCHWCDEQKTYSLMTNIWQCKTCQKNIVETLLEMAEQQ